jgi:putative membrane protein
LRDTDDCLLLALEDNQSVHNESSVLARIVRRGNGSARRSAVFQVLLVVHVLGWVFWVSGLLVTSMALTRQTQEASAEARQALTRLEWIFMRGLADLGALLTIVAGISLISTNSSYYLHAPWLHIKLTFVALLIGLHGLVAARAKRFGAGKIQLQRSDGRLMVAATLLIFLSILIATLVGQRYLR